MYPRNAASPERIAIGAVVQISDGAVQTSGVSIKVKPQGTTASAGGGTTSYEEGIVEYLPTQAETNYTSFEVIAYKTGCIPVATTIVTTASATPGTVLLAPVTHTSAVVPTVTTLTGHTAQTGDAYARLGAPAGASLSADVAAVKTQTAAIEVDTADIQSRIPAALVSGRMDSSVGAMAANVMTAAAAASDLTTELQSGLATASALATLQSSVDVVDGVVDAILVDTAVIGAAGAGLTALASATNLATVAGYLDTEIAAIKAKTDNLPADPADASDIASSFSTVNTKLDTIDDLLDTEVAAIKADTAAILLDTGTDGVVVADKTGFRLSSTGVNDILRTALTEGYAADGATFTLEQGVYMLWALLAERGLSGTTLTAKKLDGSTTAMTFTLDDGTTPTSQTRAT